MEVTDRMNRIDELDRIPYQKGQRSVVLKVMTWWLDNTAAQLRVRQRFVAWLKTEYGVTAKRCCRCKRWKPESEYLEIKTSRDGLRHHCNECDRAYKSAHWRKRTQDPDFMEKQRARRRAQWQRMKEDPTWHKRILAQRNRYYAKNREKIREQAREAYRQKREAA